MGNGGEWAKSVCRIFYTRWKCIGIRIISFCPLSKGEMGLCAHEGRV